MKLFTALALATLSPIVIAQNGPPAPQRGGMARQTSAGSGRTTAVPTNRSAASSESETIRILRLKVVQTDLALTPSELQELSSIAATLSKTSATEEIAYNTVSQALSAAQVTRLQQLLVQDLGYNALSLSDIRAQLALTESQATKISVLVSSLETAKAVLSSSVDTPNATKAKASLLTRTAAELGKVLTTDQDQRLRGLAGRALSTS